MSLPGMLPDPAPAPLDLDDDDRLIGRILSRREVLALIGAGGAATFLAACAPGGSASPAASGAASAGASAVATAAASAAIATALPACVVAPELTEGPYYLDVDLDRSDIRTNTADNVAADGTALTLDWIVSQADGSACMPMEGVVVDVWHCDALGGYSGVAGNTGDFLRGFQRTDANGRASFTTIYPGWYQGRAVHIHFKIRTDPDASAGFEFTSSSVPASGAPSRAGAASPSPWPVAAVVTLPFVASGGPALGEPALLAAALGVALLSSVVPFSLELEALRRVPVRVFGVLMSLEPAVAVLVGLVVLDEALGPRELVAIALVVAASIGAERTAHHEVTDVP